MASSGLLEARELRKQAAERLDYLVGYFAERFHADGHQGDFTRRPQVRVYTLVPGMAGRCEGIRDADGPQRRSRARRHKDHDQERRSQEQGGYRRAEAAEARRVQVERLPCGGNCTADSAASSATGTSSANLRTRGLASTRCGTVSPASFRA